MTVPLGVEGLNRSEAAEFIGVGTTLFDDLVDEGIMPRPVKFVGRTRKVWIRSELVTALKQAPRDGDKPKKTSKDSNWSNAQI